MWIKNIETGKIKNVMDDEIEYFLGPWKKIL